MSEEQKQKAEAPSPLAEHFRDLIDEMERRYSGDDDDAYSGVLQEAIRTLEERQSKLMATIERRTIDGDPYSHLELDLKIVNAQHEAFIKALTIYQDLKKLGCADRVN